MIKSLKALFAAALCTLSLNSFAVIITDVVDVNAKLDLVPFNEHSHSKSWTHNITDNGFVFGTAESASLEIAFKDDSKNDGYELATVLVHFLDFEEAGLFVDPTTTWVGTVGVSALAYLNSFGTLDVTVWSNWGDFKIGTSTLTVNTTDAPNEVSVPESSTLMLFGLGLLGLGVMRRKARA